MSESRTLICLRVKLKILPLVLTCNISIKTWEIFLSFISLTTLAHVQLISKPCQFHRQIFFQIHLLPFTSTVTTLHQAPIPWGRSLLRHRGKEGGRVGTPRSAALASFLGVNTSWPISIYQTDATKCGLGEIYVHSQLPGARTRQQQPQRCFRGPVPFPEKKEILPFHPHGWTGGHYAK